MYPFPSRNPRTSVGLLPRGPHQLGQVLKSASLSHNKFETRTNAHGFVEGQASTTVMFHSEDPIDNPGSPQFALQQMLLALSVHASTESAEKEVA